MQIKRFEAKTMTAALKMVKDEFGPNAVILTARSLRSGRGIFSAGPMSRRGGHRRERQRPGGLHCGRQLRAYRRPPKDSRRRPPTAGAGSSTP